MLTREMAPVGTMVRVVKNTVCHGYKVGEVIRVDREINHVWFRSGTPVTWSVKYSECELVDMGPFDVGELL